MAFSIPKTFIDHLIGQCDIVELIRHLLPPSNLFKKRGKNYVALCPFHEENSPSFTVNADQQFFYCFGCGSGGNAITFVTKYQKFDFVKSVEWLADYLNLTIPKQNSHSSTLVSKREKFFGMMQTALSAYQLALSQSKTALDYLKKRGVSNIITQKFQLGYAPDSWNFLVKQFFSEKKYLASELESAGLIVKKHQSHYYDRFRHRIIFPIFDDKGRCIAFGGRSITEDHLPKYLNSPETSIFTKHQILYGLYQANLENASFDRIWVVEGYMDVLSLHEKGLSQVVATLGTAIHATHLQRLSNLTEEIIFCFDGDQAGQKAAHRALVLSLGYLKDKLFIRFLMLPPGEDPDSWIQKSSLEALLPQTVSVADFLFAHLTKGIDLSTFQGKAKLVQKALPYFKKMPVSITREQLLNQLAHLANTTLQSLEHLLLTEDNKRHAYSPVHQRPTPLKYHGVHERAAGLLLQNPTLLKPMLDTTIIESLQVEYPLLAKIMLTVFDNQILNTGILLEHFKNQTEQLEYLLSLAHHDWMLPQKGIIEEFKDIILHLKKSIQKKKIHSLLDKAKKQGLSLDEKDVLYNLLSAERTITK